ncbi:MAG: hypothetical protein ACPGXK_09035 [Phycisphaerae bacterium]
MRLNSKLCMALLATGSLLATSSSTASAAPEVIEQEMQRAYHELYEVHTQIEAAQASYDQLQAQLEEIWANPTYAENPAVQAKMQAMMAQQNQLSNQIAKLRQRESEILNYIDELRNDS